MVAHLSLVKIWLPTCPEFIILELEPQVTIHAVCTPLSLCQGACMHVGAYECEEHSSLHGGSSKDRIAWKVDTWQAHQKSSKTVKWRCVKMHLWFP